ncbi:MAG: NAD(P)/FAD-dependent oxidoreductase [Pseudomonadota bacterium]
MNKVHEVYDAAIVGAGPAGLSAALTLVRSLRSVAVFDAPTPPRNAASPGIGGLLGREMVAPSDLKTTAMAELDGYGGARFVTQSVASVERDTGGGFVIVAEDGTTTRAARILLACGMVDRFPSIDGLQDYWGTSVIYCPFCHGFELRGGRWGVFVNRATMTDVAEIYLTWTNDLMLFLEPDIPLDADRQAALANKGIAVEHRRVTRLRGDGSGLEAIELEDGTLIDRTALVLWPMQAQTALVTALGPELDGDGYVVVDDGYRTSIDRLYAIGDLLYAGHQNVNTAIHMGALAAATMVLDRAIG